MKIVFLVLGMILAFVDFAQAGGAVSKVKARKNPHVQMHVQVPTPRIHVTQQPYLEGKPTIHVNTKALTVKQAPVKVKEPEYQAQVLSSGKPSIVPGRASAAVSSVSESVDLKMLVESLRANSHAWDLIVESEDKQVVVQEFINGYRKQNIVIHKPSEHYSNFIDEVSQRSPQMLDMPFDRLLQVVAVMEYDFDNGEDKDVLAQKVLGPQVYEKNKQRQIDNPTSASSQ